MRFFGWALVLLRLLGRFVFQGARAFLPGLGQEPGPGPAPGPGPGCLLPLGFSAGFQCLAFVVVGSAARVVYAIQITYKPSSIRFFVFCWFLPM